MRDSIVIGAITLFFACFSYFFPESNWNHSATYAWILVGILLIVFRLLWKRIRVPMKGAFEYGIIFSLSGAALAGFFAVMSGLLDPDIVTLYGFPGARVPIPGTSVEVCFGSSQIVLRNKDESETLLAGQHRMVGNTLLGIGHEASAAIQAETLDGATVTVTRPTGGAFLAPLLLFHRSENIANLALPFDAVAFPATDEHLSAFLIDKTIAKTEHLVRLSKGQPGLLIDIDTVSHARSGRIAFLRDAQQTRVGDLKLRIELGVYPTLMLTSVPLPAAMIIGCLAYVGGVGSLMIRSRR